MNETMYEHSGQCPWNRNQSDELEREAEDMPAEYCDICGELWGLDHLCPDWALEAELARAKDYDPSPYAITMGLDDAHDARLGWLESQLARALEV